MTLFTKLILAAATTITAFLQIETASAQDAVPDSLRLSYDFEAAVSACTQLLSVADNIDVQSLEDELVLAQNGLSMREFCSHPVVVASHNFSLEDFFLYYPLEKGAWRPLPNPLDPQSASGQTGAIYAPKDAQTLYYSAPDAAGIRNICTTSLVSDSLWTVPRLINEQITSSSDEIYPMLSPDGKSLYFASKGLYGMGGYDLYVSRWDENEQDWGVPTNLGFPYSSPYDDLLYINTEDGRYTIFASNRGCSADSVTVYVLEYDIMPIRAAVSDPLQLKELCELRPTSGKGTENGNLASITDPIQEDENTARYMDKMLEVRAKRDSLTQLGQRLDQIRGRYTLAEGEQKEALRAEILEREQQLPGLIRRVNAATAELQKVELEFLTKGIFIDPDAIRSAADQEVAGATEGYIFSKNEMGGPLEITLQKSEQPFDYNFKILETGRFARDNTLPQGLVYQIQMCSLATQLGEEQLKGLSPVFERISGGRFIYSAGLFRSYADALSQLNSVKKAGWRGAVITAFRDSEQISIRQARELEEQAITIYKLRIWPADGQTISLLSISAIQQQTDADITRTLEGAAIIYEIGPMEDRVKCEELRSTLAATGENNVQILETGIKLPE